MLHLAIDTEYGQLRDVVLASIKNFYLTDPVNATQDVYYSSAPPDLGHLISEQSAFAQVLLDNGVNIHWAVPIPDCPLQVNTRDIAAVIGGDIILGRMKWSLRYGEVQGINDIVEQAGELVIGPPTDGVLEGGDIIVHKPAIFVGISERTDARGAAFLANTIGSAWHVIPLTLKPGILHLDTVFNILDESTAIVYPEAFVDTSLQFFLDRFSHVLQVNSQEQFDLATNVFAVAPRRVIADVRNQRVNGELRNLGFTLIELEFSHTTRIGGSFRCATLPLTRDPVAVN